MGDTSRITTQQDDQTLAKAADALGLRAGDVTAILAIRYDGGALAVLGSAAKPCAEVSVNVAGTVKLTAPESVSWYSVSYNPTCGFVTIGGTRYWVCR